MRDLRWMLYFQNEDIEWDGEKWLWQPWAFEFSLMIELISS